MAELKENAQCIVFIDELHTLVGAGSAEGTLDAANILKPALSAEISSASARPRHPNFARSIEKDRALERRFQAVKVLPPTEMEALDDNTRDSRAIRGIPSDTIFTGSDRSGRVSIQSIYFRPVPAR